MCIRKVFGVSVVLGIIVGFLGLKFIGSKGEVLSFSTKTETKKEEFINPLIEVVLISPSPSAFISPSPSASPSPSSSPEPSPSPIASPSPPAGGSPRPSINWEQVHGYFDKYAGQYGIDVNILKHIAVCESGFDPYCEHLSYAGLFQFSSSAWRKYRQLLNEDTNSDLRFDAQESVKTAAYVLSINEAYIWPNCIPE